MALSIYFDGVSLTAFHSVTPVVCRYQVCFFVWWAGAGLWPVVVQRVCGCSWACDPGLFDAAACDDDGIDCFAGCGHLLAPRGGVLERDPYVVGGWICVAVHGVLTGRRSHLAGWWVVLSEAGKAVERRCLLLLPDW